MAVSVTRKTQYDEGSLDQYLRDISVYPLITREQEVSLAQRIRTNDQEALDTLVRSNLRFVVLRRQDICRAPAMVVDQRIATGNAEHFNTRSLAGPTRSPFRAYSFL